MGRKNILVFHGMDISTECWNGYQRTAFSQLDFDSNYSGIMHLEKLRLPGALSVGPGQRRNRRRGLCDVDLVMYSTSKAVGALVKRNMEAVELWLPSSVPLARATFEWSDDRIRPRYD